MTYEEIELGDLVMYEKEQVKVVGFTKDKTACVIEFLDTSSFVAGHSGEIKDYWFNKQGDSIYNTRKLEAMNYLYVGLERLTKIASTKEEPSKDTSLDLGNVVEFNTNCTGIIRGFTKSGDDVVLEVSAGAGHGGCTDRDYWHDSKGNSIIVSPFLDAYFIQVDELKKVASTKPETVSEPKEESVQPKRNFAHDIGDVITCTSKQNEEWVRYRGVLEGVGEFGMNFTLRLTHCNGVPKKLTMILYDFDSYGKKTGKIINRNCLYKDFNKDQIVPNGNQINLPLLNSLGPPPVPKAGKVSNPIGTIVPRLSELSRTNGFVLGQYVVAIGRVWEIVGFNLEFRKVTLYSKTTTGWDGVTYFTGLGQDYTDHHGKPVSFNSKGPYYTSISIESLSSDLSGLYSRVIQDNQDVVFDKTCMHVNTVGVKPLPKYVTSTYFTFPTQYPQEVVSRFVDTEQSTPLSSWSEVVMREMNDQMRRDTEKYWRESFNYPVRGHGSLIDISRRAYPRDLADVFMNPENYVDKKPEQVKLTPNKKQKPLPILQEVPTFKLNFKPSKKQTK